MAKSDLIAFETMSKMKQAFSPLPSAEETGIFSILRAVGPSSDIRELHMISKLFGFKIILQDLGSARAKTEINVNREELIMDGNSLAPFIEEVKQ
jgi:hypothetical protein